MAASGALAATLAWATPSKEGNLGHLIDTPYLHFTEQDHKLFKGTLDAVLNQAPEGKARAWAIPVSGANGDIEVLTTFKRGGANCRAASGRYNFCKQASGKWTLAN